MVLAGLLAATDTRLALAALLAATDAGLVLAALLATGMNATRAIAAFARHAAGTATAATTGPLAIIWVGLKAIRASKIANKVIPRS